MLIVFYKYVVYQKSEVHDKGGSPYLLDSACVANKMSGHVIIVYMKVLFDNKDKEDREFLIDAILPGNDFFTYTADGLSFIGRSSDQYIVRDSYINNTVWAYSSVQQFYQLAHQYYDMDDSKSKYFFDIGANIGTTCISFYKKFDQNAKIVAFEPVNENYRLLRANALLNNIPDGSYDFVNKALGAKSARGKIAFSSSNTGASSVSYLDKNSEVEKTEGLAEFGTLDEYVASHKINPSEIKYLWIDTEGFEPEVIKGAKKTLSAASIPIFMEFTPYYYNTRAHVELTDFVDILAKYYTKYIVNGSDVIHDIHELVNTPDRKNGGIVQFDIFLIK